MPELPEVETVKRALQTDIIAQQIKHVSVREPRLRWPIPADLAKKTQGQVIQSLERRGKYLLLGLPKGTLLIHLGMSGTLRLIEIHTTPAKHDHVDIVLHSGKMLRFNDPRRFGAMLWTSENPSAHPLLAQLGPEPLSEAFNSNYLSQKLRARTLPIKNLIMDSSVVVGVGNIYANEALFQAGIQPQRSAGTLQASEAEKLTCAIKDVLESAIQQGGTTLKDFFSVDGKPGYFKQSLLVYGRANLPCLHCGAPLNSCRIQQRATVYCCQCQH